MPNILRIQIVAKKVGMSVSSVRNRLNPKSKYYDPTFPKPFCLGLTGKGAVGWDEDEVDRWIESRKAKRDLAA
ncbi:AlpA family phage regulatory protein [Serratia fonticola]|uniref:AlpA family phage regulatory protein n=1 Tax=Serratia fonticola TaxID=47917 RepID=A0A448SK63_SERFO|nr:AlpA family phage regulatory protein [Serratia fonticola]MBL5862539.1 AlpA family phage regulatory protein [Serratia fonticola]MDQ9130013.1 AlpA family phage regulatory protein [Serratia fonticola]CAI0699399.1 Predicted transcriptional regulator [Serratia fonticola]VEI68114.1 Predicted transcriptional regulator [Serratia fonticola]